MPLEIAQAIVALLEGYGLVGTAFALFLLPRGIARLDHRVGGSPPSLRLLLLPGVVALWPLLAWRWFSRGAEPIERNPHRSKAGAR